MTQFCGSYLSRIIGTLDSMEMIANQLEMKFVGVDCYCTAVEQGCMIETAKRCMKQTFQLMKL